MKSSARASIRIRFFSLAVVFGVITIFIVCSSLLNGPVYASDLDITSYQYDVPASGGNAQEMDELSVSDTDLAVSIFIPGIFLGATFLMLIWAFKGRTRPDDEEETE